REAQVGHDGTGTTALVARQSMHGHARQGVVAETVKGCVQVVVRTLIVGDYLNQETIRVRYFADTLLSLEESRQSNDGRIIQTVIAAEQVRQCIGTFAQRLRCLHTKEE